MLLEADFVLSVVRQGGADLIEVVLSKHRGCLKKQSVLGWMFYDF